MRRGKKIKPGLLNHSMATLLLVIHYHYYYYYVEEGTIRALHVASVLE
jgi:hypothetical protein